MFSREYDSRGRLRDQGNDFTPGRSFRNLNEDNNIQTFFLHAKEFLSSSYEQLFSHVNYMNPD